MRNLSRKASLAALMIVMVSALACCHAGGGFAFNFTPNIVGDIILPAQGLPVYVPYVEECRLLAAPSEGEQIIVEFSIVLGSGAPDNLYVRESGFDSTYFPWEESTSVLWPLTVINNQVPDGYLLYDGSGVMTRNLSLLSAGEYTLNYLSATSPQSAGIYELDQELDPALVETKSFTFTVAP